MIGEKSGIGGQTADKRHHRFHIVVLSPLSPEELLAKMWTLNVQLAAWP